MSDWQRKGLNGWNVGLGFWDSALYNQWLKTLRYCGATLSAVLLTFPNSPFELREPFAPAGDQPTAIARLAEGVADGLAFQTLLGVTGSGKTFTMANVIARTGAPAIVLAPNKTLAAQIYSEMREFFPNNAVEYFVSYYDY